MTIDLISSNTSNNHGIFNIDSAAVIAHLDMKSCIDLMKQAQIAQYTAAANCPPRSFAPVADNNQLLVMPAAGSEVIGTKILTLFPSNSTKGVPVIQGVILLFDAITGSPLATVDAASITAIRTAAASAAATDTLANLDAASLAVIGSGVQARSHIDAILQIRDIKKINIYSRNLTKATLLAAEISQLWNIDCNVSDSAQQAVCDAQIICTVTSSSDPVIMGDWLTPGSHLNLVGAHNANMREVDTVTMKRASIFLEDAKMALIEAGDLVLPITKGELKIDEIKAEIAEVYLGKKIGRSSASEITLYKSLGNAIQDMTAAHAVYKSVMNQPIINDS